jgi:hypothetical protein
VPSDESPQQAEPQQASAARRHRIELNSVQVIASVAAAVSAAIAASALGVAGTIAGTAVVSVVATVGNALYSATLKRGKDTLVQAQQLILTRPVEQSAEPETVTVAAATVRLRDAVPGETDADTDPTKLVAANRSEPTVPLAAEPTTPPRVTPTGTGTVYGQRRRSRLTPKRVGVLAGSAALVFVLAFGVLTGIESAMGTSFSALFGHGDSGSTASALLHGNTSGGGNGGTDTGDDTSGTAGSSSPSPSASPTDTPSPHSSVTSRSHDGGATGSPSPSPRTSSPTAGTSPTTAPTATPTN